MSERDEIASALRLSKKELRNKERDRRALRRDRKRDDELKKKERIKRRRDECVVAAAIPSPRPKKPRVAIEILTPPSPHPSPSSSPPQPPVLTPPNLQLDNAADKEDLCAICLDEQTQGVLRKLTCQHTFHRACLDEWRKKGSTVCPSCLTLIEDVYICATCLVKFTSNQKLQQHEVDGCYPVFVCVQCGMYMYITITYSTLYS